MESTSTAFDRADQEKPANAPGRLARGVLAPTDAHARLVSLASAHGFDGVSHFLLPTDDARPAIDHWTTAGDAWKSEYLRHRYHAADPRICSTRRRLCPLVWDGNNADACSEYDHFRAAAAHYKIRSGVAISIRDGHAGRGVICLDSSDDHPTPERVARINESLGELILWAVLFLDCLRPASPPEVDEGTPRLTSRERECLMLAANGMTSADIGIKLNIVTRTANFHFSNITAKFGALNRAEAIALAIAQGVIPSPRPMHAPRVPVRPLAAGDYRR